MATSMKYDIFVSEEVFFCHSVWWPAQNPTIPGAFAAVAIVKRPVSGTNQSNDKLKVLSCYAFSVMNVT